MDIHLDTDIGGDMDDLCALALALRWPGSNLIGVTTAAEEGGRRAGYARYALDVARRADIPVAAGAEADTVVGYRWRPIYRPDEPPWPERIAARPAPIGDALALLRRSVEAGAMIVGLGPFTNLRLLDEAWPGILRHARLTLMGGYVQPPRAGYPQWESDTDYNVQCDVAAGPLGALLARHAAVWTALNPENADYPRDYPAMPPDFINFLHDPLAVAIALGWDGATVETFPFTVIEEDDWLRLREAPIGRPTRVATAIDAPRFNRLWVDVVSTMESGGWRRMSGIC